MTAYVDNMRAPFRGRILCHMIADTDAELHAMADRIGVARRRWQAPPRQASHYEIALDERALAIAAGAIEITQRQCASMARRRERTGALGTPEDAEAWWRNQVRAQRSQPPR